MNMYTSLCALLLFGTSSVATAQVATLSDHEKAVDASVFAVDQMACGNLYAALTAAAIERFAARLDAARGTM